MRPSKFHEWFEGFLTISLFVVLILSVLVHSSPTNKIGRDSGAFLYIGQMINESKLPYRDAWDSKPPAIFYINALGLLLGSQTRWGVWGLEVVFLLTAVLISYMTMKGLWGKIPALGGTLLWVWGLDILFTFDGGNMTEEYPLFMHFLSIYLFFKLLQKPGQYILYFILGLNFGLSFLFRPNNAMIELIVICILALAQIRQGIISRQIGSFILIGIGTLFPILLTALYFARFGLFNELLDATLLYNFSYGSTKMGTQTPFERLYVVLGGLAWFSTLGYGLALFRFYKSIKSKGEDFYLFLLLTVGTPLCVFLSDLAQRGYEHYFINALPMLGFLAGLVFYVLTEVKPPALGGKGYVIILTSLFVAACAFFVLSGRMDQYFLSTDISAKKFWNKNQRFTPISKYVRINSKPDDTVLFWGAWPGENFMASRISPSAVLFYPTLAPSEITNRLDAKFLEEIKSNKPALIVDMIDPFIPSIDPLKRELQSGNLLWAHLSGNLDELFSYILDNYVLQEVVAGKDIYYRIGTK